MAKKKAAKKKSAKKKSTKKTAVKKKPAKKGVKKKAAVKKKAVKKSTKKKAQIFMDDDVVLTKEIAEGYLQDTRSCDLSVFTKLEDDAAEILSSHTDFLYLDGLRTLSDCSAECLGRHVHHLSLNGLAILSDAAAVGLGMHKENLCLNGLTNLTDAAATSLSPCRDLELDELHRQVPDSWLWKTRRVILGDGSKFTMADTEANQKEYPQQSGQKAGCGFPMMRALVLFSLATGSVIECAIGPYSGKLTGENSLLRTLHSALRKGDILVLDRYFSGWCDIALMMKRGIDVVVRKHQLRKTDFRTGRRVGTDDHLVRWVKRMS